MRPMLALAALALLLSGCAGDPASGGAAVPSGDVEAQDSAPFADAPRTMRFASGDYEGNLAGTATFSIAAQCVFDCAAGGEAIVDLTPIIPPDAPVELTVTVYGANCMMSYEDAYAIGFEDGEFGEFDGQKAVFSGIVTRGPAGKVELHVFNPGGFSIPPEQNPTADYEASSVVRADRLVAGMPAAVQLAPGDRLNLTDSGVDEAILIAPDGTVTRDQSEPFELVANGTQGTYIVIMGGTDSTRVLGPDVPLQAKRLARVQEDPHPVNGPASWTFAPPGIPVQVGLVIHSGHPPAETPLSGFNPAAFSTGWSFTVTGPGDVELLREDDSFCQPFCGGGFMYSASTDFLDEGLRPGEYAVDLQFQGNGAEAYLFATIIA